MSNIDWLTGDKYNHSKEKTMPIKKKKKKAKKKIKKKKTKKSKR